MVEQSRESRCAAGQPRKRKLKYRRTTRACKFCRKRKVRCSGLCPCDTCAAEGVSCEYEKGRFTELPSPPGAVADPAVGSASISPNQHQNPRALATGTAIETDQATDARGRDQESLDPDASQDIINFPQAFAQGHHVGPSAGVSFLYQSYDKDDGLNQDDLNSETNTSPSTRVPLVSYGDVIPLGDDFVRTPPTPNFTSEQILYLVGKYFQYISPTIRFLHHPTVNAWAQSYVNQESHVRAAQKATVLLVCAQTNLHIPADPNKSPALGKGDLPLSMACAAKAKALLENEQGAPSLASVQARIALTLYLLSSFRLSECRFCFSFTVTLAISLGIHRGTPSQLDSVDVLNGENKKRAFWSIYVLDGYLSVMLGRPRLIRDDDIDQPFPHNIDDHDLSSSDTIENLPRHGNLEAFTAHAMLSRIMARMNDELYSLHPLSDEQVLQRSTTVLGRLDAWQQELPEFLKPRDKTLTGQRTFERQNTILKLASAHVRILATRRCLVSISSQTKPHSPAFTITTDAEKLIRECVVAILTVLDTVETLIQHGQCNAPFWSTQYIAIVAISTLYVLVIQSARDALPGDVRSFFDADALLAKTKLCQEHLNTLPPKGSQAERHYVLLDSLGVRARNMWNARRDDQRTYPSRKRRDINPVDASSLQGPGLGDHIDNSEKAPAHKEVQYFLPPGQSGPDVGETVLQAAFQHSNSVAYDIVPESSIYESRQTDVSTSDFNIGEGFDYRWESLDAIGFCTKEVESFLQYT